MADATLPLPPVQDSYSSRLHGSRGRHTSLSTNMGSILQQPSNFLIKPVRPCLNLTCKRYCTKTRIRQHMRRPKGLAVFQGFTVWFFLFWSEKTWTDKTPDHQRNFQLLPAPLQLLALTLSQARLFLILLPEKSEKISMIPGSRVRSWFPSTYEKIPWLPIIITNENTFRRPPILRKK